MFFLAPLAVAAASAASSVGIIEAVGGVAVPVIGYAVKVMVAEEVTKQVALKVGAAAFTTVVAGSVAHHVLSSDADAQVKVSRDGVEAEVKHH